MQYSQNLVELHYTAWNLTALQHQEYWASSDNSRDYMWISNFFELFRTLLYLELFRTFPNFKLISSNFTTMVNTTAKMFYQT